MAVAHLHETQSPILVQHNGRPGSLLRHKLLPQVLLDHTRLDIRCPATQTHQKIAATLPASVSVSLLPSDQPSCPRDQVQKLHTGNGLVCEVTHHKAALVQPNVGTVSRSQLHNTADIHHEAGGRGVIFNVLHTASMVELIMRLPTQQPFFVSKKPALVA